MVAACRTGLNHGVLLLLRHLVPSLPWESPAHELPALRGWVARLLAVLDRVAIMATPPLCHPTPDGTGGAPIHEHEHAMAPMLLL